MDKFADYVLGKEDGIPEDPRVGLDQVRRPAVDHQGAGPRVGQEDHVHRPLLRRLHGPRAVLARAGRLECVLLGMQGLGKPGVHCSGRSPTSACLAPRASRAIASSTRHMPRAHPHPHPDQLRAWGKQLIPKTLIQEAIFKPVS